MMTATTLGVAACGIAGPRSPVSFLLDSNPEGRMAPTDSAEVEGLREEIKELRSNIAVLNQMQGRMGSLTEKFALINRITQELNSLDLDRIADIAAYKIPQLLGARYCSLFLYDYGQDELVLKSHNHPEPITGRLTIRDHKNTIMGLALRRKKIILTGDLEEFEKREGVDVTRTFADKYASRSCISAPLKTGNFTVGVLNFADKADGGVFDEVNDLPIVDQLAQVVAMAIWNCNLFREVQVQARTDGLTHLSNYRTFYETLRAEMHRSVRYKHELTLAMIDVDKFKDINDTFGHQFGDAVLVDLAKTIADSVRAEDLTARYGGDEIVLLLPEIPPQGAVVLADRILAKVREKKLSLGGKEVPFSVSIGMAGIKPELTISEFVEAADKALYRAKEKGRDRYEIAGE